MSDQESIFYKHNQKGDIVINLNLSAFRNLIWWLGVSLVGRPFVSLINLLYASISVVSAHRPLLFILSGLGLGFGLGLVVFQRPMTTLASPFPLAAQKSLISARQLEVGHVLFEVTATDSETNNGQAIHHLTTSAPLGTTGTVVLNVGWRHEINTYLEQTTLNDPLILIGSNNGRYEYRVVEIKEVGNEVLPTLFDQTGKALVLYTPSNLLQAKYLVVIAK